MHITLQPAPGSYIVNLTNDTVGFLQLLQTCVAVPGAGAGPAPITYIGVDFATLQQLFSTYNFTREIPINNVDVILKATAMNSPIIAYYQKNNKYYAFTESDLCALDWRYGVPRL